MSRKFTDYMLQPKSILFDFDYTLADSSRGACECINFALAQMGLGTVAAEDACRTIGLSLPRTFAALVAEKHWPRADEFAALFFQRADEVIVDMTELYPAVPGVLGELAGRGLALGIVSTKRRHRIEAILLRDGLAGRFQVIIGGEDVAVHKPDPRGLLAALDRLGHAPGESLYVGDSVVDAETAAAAGVPFAAVLSGTTPAGEFADFAALHVLADVGALSGVIAAE